jgi:putative sporulation protein YyaC
MSRTVWIDSRLENAADILAQNLRCFIDNVNISRKPLAFVCIGSAKITGDNLGPLVGTVLSRCFCSDVYGTMNMPFDAITLNNCPSVLDMLDNHYFTVAIDAAIGSAQQTGFITLSNSSLSPGAGVSRILPAVGHLHITGVFDSLDSLSARALLPAYCRHISLGLLKAKKTV